IGKRWVCKKCQGKLEEARKLQEEQANREQQEQQVKKQEAARKQRKRNELVSVFTSDMGLIRQQQFRHGEEYMGKHFIMDAYGRFRLRADSNLILDNDVLVFAAITDDAWKHFQFVRFAD